ncbi:unnamed protein product [Cochlearia groenlandica]
MNVSTSSTSSLYDSEAEELKKMALEPPKVKSKKRLSKQLSMLETQRDKAWERRRRQMLQYNIEGRQINEEGGDHNDLTDEDLRELKGSIELGFGFNEEEGQQLTNTLPALDLYFAVNRQISPVSSPSSGGSSSSSRPTSLGDRSSSFGSDTDGLRFISPGDSPLQVKARLRHWAQAVACSVIQSHN